MVSRSKSYLWYDKEMTLLEIAEQIGCSYVTAWKYVVERNCHNMADVNRVLEWRRAFHASYETADEMREYWRKEAKRKYHSRKSKGDKV